jgi:hypothetical protein
MSPKFLYENLKIKKKKRACHVDTHEAQTLTLDSFTLERDWGPRTYLNKFSWSNIGLQSALFVIGRKWMVKIACQCPWTLQFGTTIVRMGKLIEFIRVGRLGRGENKHGFSVLITFLSFSVWFLLPTHCGCRGFFLILLLSMPHYRVATLHGSFYICYFSL